MYFPVLSTCISILPLVFLRFICDFTEKSISSTFISSIMPLLSNFSIYSETSFLLHKMVPKGDMYLTVLRPLEEPCVNLYTLRCQPSGMYFPVLSTCISILPDAFLFICFMCDLHEKSISFTFISSIMSLLFNFSIYSEVCVLLIKVLPKGDMYLTTYRPSWTPCVNLYTLRCQPSGMYFPVLSTFISILPTFFSILSKGLLYFIVPLLFLLMPGLSCLSNFLSEMLPPICLLSFELLSL
ncbi:unnamed protein product [Meganyctiphanes norvegica]|uniref:Uncharacterized protein n=1 Tax=Meganyctiphanes norvegica TaxID=48144 RepID=A0AAV2R8Y0_MEGNR